jgi:hypothetical protein
MERLGMTLTNANLATMASRDVYFTRYTFARTDDSLETVL